MTAFEEYLSKNGYVLTHGKFGSFSTYDNTSRSWYNKETGKRFLIGLYAKPTRIGIIEPQIYKNGELFTSLPTEDMFNDIINGKLGYEQKN